VNGEDELISEFRAEVRTHKPELADELDDCRIQHLGNVVGVTPRYGDIRYLQIHLEFLISCTQRIFGPDTLFGFVEPPTEPDEDEVDDDRQTQPENDLGAVRNNANSDNKTSPAARPPVKTTATRIVDDSTAPASHITAPQTSRVGAARLSNGVVPQPNRATRRRVQHDRAKVVETLHRFCRSGDA